VVEAVELQSFDRGAVPIRFFGVKPLLLFYVDPDAYLQNRSFRDSLKVEYRDSARLACCVVVNMKDASPFVPNALARKVAEKEVEGVPAQLCYDFKRALRDAWRLEGVNNTCTVVLVGARGEVLFFKAGALTGAEKRVLRGLLDDVTGR
jgi:predicted transcriptional regulator